MRLPSIPRAACLCSALCLWPSPTIGQETGESTSDLAVDELVNDAWADRTGWGADMGEPEGEILELSLEAARAIGLTNDLRLQAQQEGVDAAQHREVGSWAAFDWVFNASGNLSDAKSDASNIFDAANSSIDTTTQDVSFGFERAFSAGGSLSLSYGHNNTRTNSFFNLLETSNQDVLSAVYTRPLMRGSGRDYVTSVQGLAGLRLERERELYRLARQELLVQVDLLYWDLVLAERQMEVAGSALDLALQQLERDRRRRDAGVATEVEVIQDEATVARRIEGVLLAETNLRTAMDVLRSALFPGLGSETWTVQLKTITPLPDPATGLRALAWQDEIESSVVRRGEVRVAALDVEIASLQHERALNERQPLLDFLVQLNSEGYDSSVGGAIEETLSYDFPTLAAGLNFQLPMGNVALDREERASRALLRAARLTLDAHRSEVASGVREALRRVNYQAEASRAASKTREAAERLMEAERARYEQGLSTNFQVLEFQQALVEARYAEEASRAAYGQSLANLSRERGSAGEALGDQAP